MTRVEADENDGETACPDELADALNEMTFVRVEQARWMKMINERFAAAAEQQGEGGAGEGGPVFTSLVEVLEDEDGGTAEGKAD